MKLSLFELLLLETVLFLLRFWTELKDEMAATRRACRLPVSLAVQCFFFFFLGPFLSKFVSLFLIFLLELVFWRLP